LRKSLNDLRKVDTTADKIVVGDLVRESTYRGPYWHVIAVEEPNEHGDIPIVFDNGEHEPRGTTYSPDYPVTLLVPEEYSGHPYGYDPYEHSLAEWPVTGDPTRW
jgi:hypothetical protein